MMGIKTPYEFNVELFRELVAQTGANYEELSAGMGISQAALAQYMCCRTVPTFNSLIKISKYFQVPVDVLIGLHTMEDYSELLKGNREFMLKCRTCAYEEYLLKRKDAGAVAVDAFLDKDVYYSSYPYNLMEHIFCEPMDHLLSEDQMEGLTKAIASLSPREQRVIYLYFAEERTLQQIGKVFNLTQERIRQIVRTSLRKLRNPVRSNMIRNGIRGEELKQLETLEAQIDAKKQLIEERLSELKELENNVNITVADIKKTPVGKTKLDTLFIDLDLSVRSYNCLKRAGCITVDDVLKLMSDGKIFKVRNLGRKSIAEIQEKIGSTYHITFKPVFDKQTISYYEYEYEFPEVS